MAVFKCKMCGGSINVTDGVTVAECEYCGTKQTVPDVNDEKKLNLYNRANLLRMNSEFDRAGAIYEQIIAEFPEEAEAYWGLCLCNYGIEYVDDPATGAKIPTVHRASFEKLRKDENYRLANDYADLGARALYQEQAKEIDRIMGEILSISANESPYDIFICYKETDNKGDRTIDSVIAQDIYDELTKKGYKVFFSRITLEDKLGMQYEPYIFAALNSAKVMLAIGTDYEYFNAVWVKNEWSRFIKLAAKDKSKILIPCFKDMDAYDLPDKFKSLQAQDMNKLGFMQDLIRGIDKIFGRGNMPATAAVEDKITPLLKRAFMFLEDGSWKEADEYCEKVLDIEPENAKAYLGKLMAERNVRNQTSLKDCKEPFEKSNNYQKVCRFDPVLAEELKADNAFIRERNETARKQAEEARLEAVREKREFELKVESVVAALKKSDSKKEKQKIEAEISYLQKLLADFDRNITRLNYLKSQSALLRSECDKLSQQISALGMFKFKEKTELSDKLSRVKADFEACNNEMSGLADFYKKYNNKSNLTDAIYAKRSRLNDFNDSMTGVRELSYIEAKHLADSDEQLKKAVLLKYPSLQIHLTDVGDYTAFGSYPQTADGTRIPIEWLVLEKTDKTVLLISKYALDNKKYNESYVDVTWETCTLRRWLNGTFLNNAFSADEQAKIATVNISADENPQFFTNPGNATTDKVFLLSITEVKKYFKTDKSRQCAPTAYAKAQGAYTSNDYKTTSGGAACWWWLRSPGLSQNYAATVYTDGSVFDWGEGVRDGNGCVRPALRINLDS